MAGSPRRKWSSRAYRRSTSRRSRGRSGTGHSASSPRPTPCGRRSRVTSSRWRTAGRPCRSEEHTSELQSQSNLVCRLLLEKKKIRDNFKVYFKTRKLYAVKEFFYILQ